MNATELHRKLLEKGKEKARTAAYYSTCDRLRKQVRASLMVYHINEGTTVSKAECLALIDTKYKEACQRCEEAQEAAGVAAVEYAAAEAYFEAWRTLEATKRAEMKLT